MSAGRTDGQITRGLVRYVPAAVLARGADGGAAVGLVLLAMDPGLRLPGAAATGGLLAGALSAPHLLGPWTARRLDHARDARWVLAAAFLVYAAALAAGSLLLGRAPVWTAVAAVAAAGCCGPLLTGGLSSRLPGTSGADGKARRRAQGWDALTYGIGGTAGPAAVAGLAGLFGPLTAMLALSGAAALAAGLAPTLSLERSNNASADPAPGVLAGIGVLVGAAPLRRVTTLTLLGALGMGALPVIAAVLGPHLTGRPGAGATLTVAYGLGNLGGSLLATIFPLRGEPERLALRLFAAVAVTFVLGALAPGFALTLVAFALVGVANALSFTATLTARTAYAPVTARAQVFVTSAGLKVAVSSAGSAAAGAMAGLGGRTLLLLCSGVGVAALLSAGADRLACDRRQRGNPAARDPACEPADPPIRARRASG
ncbi:MFS transporter [Actinoallomurus spadix]|uniref:MFS transporter n=1 Tax=Actinoallomurus spadix TaxID=79912 RepID=A0ABN0WML7_9ACTN|nr:MFS transporter [Actinoallomurus spadix]MCO5984636.1 MFS transporter [Actinoallomurus spadix]